MIKNGSITVKEGKNPGKTVAVFAGTHGDEKAGVIALEKVIKDVEVISGKVYFVFANPEAIKKNVRFVEKNLNRCFLEGNNNQALEDKRAKELMKILDECAAFLDLHASRNPKSIPFIICEKEEFDIAKKIGVNIISTGWHKLLPGSTADYMHRDGKIGIGLECGSIVDSKNKANLAEDSIYLFLQYFKNIEEKRKFHHKKQRQIIVTKIAIRQSKELYFAKDFADFEKLEAGKVFAKDGNKEYFAEEGEIIIFPSTKRPIGVEAFIIGKEANHAINSDHNLMQLSKNRKPKVITINRINAGGDNFNTTCQVTHGVNSISSFGLENSCL